MRYIIFFFWVAFISDSVFSQQPTQEQIRAQMAQAKNESLQMITELEKEITEAKKKGDDPESIQEMEKQLAMMKKMMGVIDKASNIKQAGPKNIEGSNTVAPYKSSYVRFYKQPVVAPTEAQAKDKLLWYKGKKINQNTLITTNGRVIQYDRQNNRVLVQVNEKKDTNFLKIVNNLSKSRQLTQKYVDWVSAKKNSFFDYPLVMMAMKEFELIEKRFDKIVNNSLELPGTGSNPRAEVFYESSLSNSGPSDVENSIDPYIEQQIEYIRSLVNNPPPLDVTPPPKKDYSLCFACGDPTAQERYDRELEIWGTAFKEYEVSIMSRVLAIERYYQLMGLSSEEDVGTMFTGELGKAWSFAQDRIDKKVEILKQRYGNDIYRYEAVVSTVLGEERQKQLLGMGSDNGAYEIELFLGVDFEKFVRDRIAANDYDVMFNYAMIFNFARQKQLLGYVDDDQNVYSSLIEAVVKHNRFALTLDLDFELHMEVSDKPAWIATGTLTTRQKLYLKLGRNKDCKWQFYLFDANYDIFSQESAYMIPLTVTGGSKKLRQGEDYITFPYSGPTDVIMAFPSFRISFCNGANKDSAMMDVLRYEQENLPACDFGKAYCLDMLGFANKALVSILDTKANLNPIADILDQMVDMSAGEGSVDDPTGYVKLDKMQVAFKMNGKQHDLQKRVTETSKMDNTVMLFDAQNGSSFLINATLNTADIELGLHIKKGIIKLKVVNEPL